MQINKLFLNSIKMQINKLYISLKHWPALPSPGLAGHGPSVAPLAWPSSPRLFLFGKKSFRRFYSVWSRLDVHLPYLIVEICSQRSHKKCEKREKGQCYYPFCPWDCGWNAVLKDRWVPIAFWKLSQNFEVNKLRAK